MQNRFRSKTAWGALLALILFILKKYFSIQISDADILIDLILLAASSFGIFNNPTDGENF